LYKYFLIWSSHLHDLNPNFYIFQPSKQSCGSWKAKTCPHFPKMTFISTSITQYGPLKDWRTRELTHAQIPQTHYWVMLTAIINLGNCDQTSVSLMICSIFLNHYHMLAQHQIYTQTTVVFTLLRNPSSSGWMFGHKHHTGGKDNKNKFCTISVFLFFYSYTKT